MSKEYIPRQVLEHHVLEHYTNSETHFFIYEKQNGPVRESADVRVWEFFGGRKVSADFIRLFQIPPPLS